MFQVTLKPLPAASGLLQVEVRNTGVEGQTLDYETAGLMHPASKFEFSDPAIHPIEPAPVRPHNVKLWLGYDCSFHYGIRLNQHFTGFPARTLTGKPASEVLVRFHDPDTGSISDWTPAAW